MINQEMRKEDHNHEEIKTKIGLTIRQIFDCGCWYCGVCLQIVEFCNPCETQIKGEIIAEQMENLKHEKSNN